jgi:two-component system, LytTR family, sensor histidine kinase AlgZ
LVTHVPDFGEGSLIRGTLRALLAAKRAVPIVLVSAPLVVVQARYSQPSSAGLLGILMCLASVVVAPISWRVLFPEGLDLGHGMIRVLLYLTVDAGVVLTIGAVIPKVFDIPITLMTERPSLLTCAALFAVGGWWLARDIGLEKTLAHARSRTEALAREAEMAQLLALHAHLDPHFIFNTLGSIAEWCRQDGEVAERAVLQLASMLRTILSGVRTSAWPLAKEIDLVQNLLALYQQRDPELFRMRVEVAPTAQAIPVPPMILLPLVENAIKHGPAAGHQGELELRAAVDGEQLQVQVENPGSYLGPRAGSVGLPTVERRLGLAYDDRASFSISSSGERTRVELRLPLAGPMSAKGKP